MHFYLNTFTVALCVYKVIVLLEGKIKNSKFIKLYRKQNSLDYLQKSSSLSLSKYLIHLSKVNIFVVVTVIVSCNCWISCNVKIKNFYLYCNLLTEPSHCKGKDKTAREKQQKWEYRTISLRTIVQFCRNYSDIFLYLSWHYWLLGHKFSSPSQRISSLLLQCSEKRIC